MTASPSNTTFRKCSTEKGGHSLRHQRRVEADEPRTRLERAVQGRDVAVAGDHLGVAADRVPVEVGQDPRTAPAAADREDRAHGGVGEEGVHVCGAVLVAPRQVAVAAAHVGAQTGLEREGAHDVLRDLDVDREEVGLRRRHEADAVTRLEAFRPDRRQRRAGRAIRGAPFSSTPHREGARSRAREEVATPHGAGYRPPANDGSARLRIVCRPGAAASTAGIVLTVIEAVAMSPW